VVVDLLRGGAAAGNEVTTTDYSDPAVRDYGTKPLRLEAGDGFRCTCSYRNTAAMPSTFGATSEDETSFAIGFYHPDDDTPLALPRGCPTSGSNGHVCPLN
jgi:hypothetical protein